MYTADSTRGWPSLAATDDAVETVVRELFAESHSPSTAVRVSAEADDLSDHRRQVEWTVDGEARRPDDLAGVLFSTLGVMNRVALDHDSDRLHLHAALVGDSTSQLLIAGSAGAGKTTLVASLLDRGLAYGTDEMVAIDADGTLEPLRKPLGLKAGSLTRFEFARRLRHPALCSWPPERSQPGVPPRWLPDAPIRASAIVLPERFEQTSGSTSLKTVPGPQAIRVLAEHTFDFDRFGPVSALRALAELVNRTPVLRLFYRDAAEAGRFLQAEPLPKKTTARPVVFVTPMTHAPGTAAVRRESGSCGVALEDGGVVWCPSPSRLTELSGPGFAVWASADGGTSPAERATALDATLEDVTRIDRTLVSQGLLSRTR